MRFNTFHNNTYFGPNTKTYQHGIVYSYGQKLICADESYGKPYKTYFGEDAIDTFFSISLKSKCCSEVIETEFNEPLVMTKNDHEDL